jgi:WD repeat-containing protein 76
MGNLGIFDASQTANPAPRAKPVKADDPSENDEPEDDDLLDPEITSFHLHTRTISSLQFSPANPSHLYTSSYDSSLRLLDLVTSKSTEIYGPEDQEADEPLSGIETDPSSPHVLYFSRLDGHVGRHDTRAGGKAATTLWQLSEKKIGGFSVHPQHPHYLATASLDRTMRLWDLRKMVWWEGTGRRPAMLGEHTSRLSVSHAAFNGAGQVATTSYDDTVKVHSFEGMGSWKEGQTLGETEMEPSAVVKHNNQTGRWVTMYVGCSPISFSPWPRRR